MPNPTTPIQPPPPPHAPLEYAFVSSPGLIHASSPVDGSATAADSRVDLEVVITNPGPAVPLVDITIQIPLGTGDNQLSTVLPQPEYDTSGPWKIELVKGGTIRITPNPNYPDAGGGGPKSATATAATPTPKPRMMTAAIVFSLKQITVNEVAGSVPITIDEFSPNHLSKFLQLDKWPAGFPVTSFTAEETIFSEPDLVTTLHWTCSKQGEPYTYQIVQVHEGDEVWRSDRLLWDRGIAGILTPPVQSTSQFELKVFDDHGTEITVTNSDGTARPLRLTIWIEAPVFSAAAKLVPYFGGRVARLHWLAEYTADCSIEVTKDGQTYAQIDHAPADTTVKGCWVATGDEPGAVFEIGLTARAKTGSATAYYRDFPSIAVRKRATFSTTASQRSIAITPDNTTALVGGSGHLALVNLNSGQTETIQVGDYVGPTGIAVTPNGNFALMVTEKNVTSVNLRTKQVSSQVPINFPDLSMLYRGISPICLTPDSKRAFVLTLESLFSIDNIETGERGSSTIRLSLPQPTGYRDYYWKGGCSLALSRDGKFAFAAVNLDEGQIRLIDLTKVEETTTVMARGKMFSDLAVTPNGLLLLATDCLGKNVAVIDIARRQVVANVPVDEYPHAIAVTPDGRLALVATTISGPSNEREKEGSLAIIDIANGSVVTKLSAASVPDGYENYGAVPSQAAADVAITNANPPRAVIANWGTPFVTVI